MGRKMLFHVKGDDDAADILWNGYAYENFDRKQIESLIDLLVPENMFCLFQSFKLNKDKEENPDLY